MSLDGPHSVTKVNADISGIPSQGEIEQSIVEWLKNYLADLLNLSVDELDRSITFQQYGLDSSAAVGLSGDLGMWLGCDIDPAIAYEFPSINELAKALADDAAVRNAFGKRHSIAGKESADA
ncbi:MAG: acyl carrier protein [Pseudomonadota bacterium]